MPVSGQTLSVSFVPTDTTNYNNASKNVSINVLKATPTITWNNPADIIYGTALSATQLNATASVPVSLTYTPPATTVLNAGNGQTLSVNFVPTDTANYNNASQNVSINVLEGDADHYLEQPSRHRLRHCAECGSTQCGGKRPGCLNLHTAGRYGIECRQRSDSFG